MPATLKLDRETNLVMELRRGPFDVILDGQSVDSIEAHQTVDVPIEPGHHTLQVRTGRYSSRPHSFDIHDGETATYRCSGGIIWPLYLASLVKTDLALVLKPESTP
ncbi:MAG TPA: hypothetical protein VGI44_06775 [Acidimicrobiales bacterium]|jgi:hypothetical protein